MTTPNIGLTELANGQANYLNANDAFAVIDAILQTRAISKTLTAAPGSPANGDVYIMQSAWAGVTTLTGGACAAGDIAFYRSSAGVFKAIRPKEGWRMEVAADDTVYRFDGSAWLAVSGAGVNRLNITNKSIDYTFILGDAEGGFLHPSADPTARTWTIPENASVAYDIGTAITFINQASAGVITIAITTDTMRLAGAGTTGSRTLAANGIATALKVAATEWIISGVNLT